jgi:hypothetical protein
MFQIDVLRFSEFRTMRNHLAETLMLNDIQMTGDYMSRWVVLKRREGAVTSQRVLKVLFYVNILQCFFVVENKGLVETKYVEIKTIPKADSNGILNALKHLFISILVMNGDKKV